MDKNIKEQKTKYSKYEWMLFVESYLSLARIGLEELKCKNYLNNKFEQSICYEDKLLLIAVIYNVKQAIEIIIKLLGISIDENYLRCHDSKELIKDLKSKMPAIKKQDKLDELAELTLKYYKCEFWNSKIIKESNIFDCKNDVFRFPDNSASFVLNLEFFKNIGDEEIRELLDDIKKLKQLVNILFRKIKEAKNPKLFQ